MVQKKRTPPVPRTMKIYRRDVKVEHYPKNLRYEQPERRESIHGMSYRSRRRLAFVANNTHVNLDSMVTLTYPARWPKDGRECKRHLNAFMSWMRRRIVPFSYLWFLEFQKRGAPHFHIFYAANGLKICPNELGDAWARICDMGDKNHAAAGTRVERLRSPDGAGRYAAKYATKQEQKETPEQFRNVGRFWGHSRDVKPKPLTEVDLRGVFHLTGMVAGWEHAEDDRVMWWGTLFGASEQVLENMGLDTIPGSVLP